MRPLVDLPSVSVPEGALLVPWPHDRDGETLVMRNLAFADHWGSTPIAPETWQQVLRGHGARPDLSVVALEPRPAKSWPCVWPTPIPKMTS